MQDQAQKSPLRRRAIGISLGLVVAVMIAYRKPIEAALLPVFESVAALGAWAPVVLMLLYIPACLLLVPNTFISPGVGFLLGPIWGLPTALVGATLGHAVTFGLSRLLGRRWFAARVPENRRYRAVELACRRDGFKIVSLTRLTPAFPSNIMSYFFGITSVTWSAFTLGTVVGLFPRTLIATTVGAAAKSFLDASHHSDRDDPLSQPLFIGTFIVVTTVVVLVITRIARRSLTEALERESLPSEPAVDAT